jgi:hypothetical protein
MNSELHELSDLLQTLQFDADLNSVDVEVIRDTVRKLVLSHTQLKRDFNNMNAMLAGILEGLVHEGKFEKTAAGKYAVNIDPARLSTEEQ